MDFEDSPLSGRAKFGMGENDGFSPGARSTSASSPSLGGSPGNELAIADDYLASPSPGGNYQPRTAAYFHRPSTVARVGGNHAVVEFNNWAQSIPSGWDQIHQMFIREDANPAGGTYMDNGSQGMRGIAKKRWIQLLMSKGYPNEENAAEVFDEIAKEILSDKKGRLVDLMEAPAETTITLPQLKRFERRMVSVNATLSASDEQSPAGRFIKFLVKERGSTLRGWRMELDKRASGRVAFVDFTNACRNLGISSQGKLIWNNLRQDKVTPLEFHELDPKEANNLEDFAETLWSTVGFDLGKAWMFLDTNNQNYLSYEEWKSGVKKLGFEGDAKILFKGLDTSGLGRVKRSEFEYIGKVSRIAQSRLGGGQGPKAGLTELITWVQRELGGAHELIVKLGLGNGEKDIVVGDLAARLTALGFEGDALQAATRAARSEGGTHISAEALYSLLCGGRPKAIDRKCGRAHMSAGSPRQQKGAWCNGVDNISVKNSLTCKYQRGYFQEHSNINRDERQAVVLAQQRSQGSLRSVNSLPVGMEDWSISARPAWSDNFDHVAQASNTTLPSHSRKYFSNPADKPVREEIRAIVRQRKADVEG